jgi:hypothetical protein
MIGLGITSKKDNIIMALFHFSSIIPKSMIEGIFEHLHNLQSTHLGD